MRAAGHSSQAPGWRLRMACGFWQRARGLLARPAAWLADDELLAIVPCHAVHTFGMRSPIDVAFLDSSGRVLSVRKSMPPGAHEGCPGACVALERITPQRPDGLPWFEKGARVCIAPCL